MKIQYLLLSFEFAWEGKTKTLRVVRAHRHHGEVECVGKSRLRKKLRTHVAVRQ